MLENEITNCLKIVHVYEEERGIPPNLEERVRILDQIYPKLKIDLVSVGRSADRIRKDLIGIVLGID